MTILSSPTFLSMEKLVPLLIFFKGCATLLASIAPHLGLCGPQLPRSVKLCSAQLSTQMRCAAHSTRMYRQIQLATSRGDQGFGPLRPCSPFPESPFRVRIPPTNWKHNHGLFCGIWTKASLRQPRAARSNFLIEIGSTVMNCRARYATRSATDACHKPQARTSSFAPPVAICNSGTCCSVFRATVGNTLSLGNWVSSSSVLNALFVRSWFS